MRQYFDRRSDYLTVKRLRDMIAVRISQLNEGGRTVGLRGRSRDFPGRAKIDSGGQGALRNCEVVRCCAASCLQIKIVRLANGKGRQTFGDKGQGGLGLILSHAFRSFPSECHELKDSSGAVLECQAQEVLEQNASVA